MDNKKIWIDLDNSPHVPFFYPIIQELEKKGYEIILTARDCFQVCGLADKLRLNYIKIGRHYGSNLLLKVLGTLWRSIQLMPYIIMNRPVLSISHGSRSLLILSHALRVPSILMFDYEHTAQVPIFRPFLGMAPEIIDGQNIQSQFKNGVASYPGLKEDVYVASFRPDPKFLSILNLNQDDIIVTIRPPATEAHYHNPEAESLFVAVVEYLGKFPDIKMVILPRNEVTQRSFIQNTWKHFCRDGKIIIPQQVINGLDMIWHSDFVISGGGTMNREAAALGVPVFSIFRGKMGAVDKYLSEKGRLIFIENVNDIRTKIKPVKRDHRYSNNLTQRPALDNIVSTIDQVMANFV